MTTRTPLRTTIDMLRRCGAARAAGVHVSYTTDPTWLVNMAINRRAGWPDDTSCSRGSCRPTNDGRYPPKAEGSTRYNHLCLLARAINDRRVVRVTELGGWRALLCHRMPNRFEGVAP